jgi:hypothetical protein
VLFLQLIGGHSDDIDIALDNMMGRVFAEKVNEHMTRKGMETHHIGIVQVEGAMLGQYHQWKSQLIK